MERLQRIAQTFEEIQHGKQPVTVNTFTQENEHYTGDKRSSDRSHRSSTPFRKELVMPKNIL